MDYCHTYFQMALKNKLCEKKIRKIRDPKKRKQIHDIYGDMFKSSAQSKEKSADISNIDPSMLVGKVKIR